MGCGTGILSLAADRCGARELIATDSSMTAVHASRRNCGERVQCRCDWMAGEPQGIVDIILTNPPFHSGLSTRYDIGNRWLTSLLPWLAPDGTVYLVANQFLPYASMARDLFESIQCLEEADGFAVYKLSRQQKR